MSDDEITPVHKTQEWSLHEEHAAYLQEKCGQAARTTDDPKKADRLRTMSDLAVRWGRTFARWNQPPIKVSPAQKIREIAAFRIFEALLEAELKN